MTSHKPSLLKIVFFCFLIGLAVNTIFMKLSIGGVVRELSRLSILVGVILMIIGGIRKLLAGKSTK